MWRRQHGLDAIAGSDLAAGGIGGHRLFRPRFLGGVRGELARACTSARTCASAFQATGSARGSDDRVGSANSS